MESAPPAANEGAAAVAEEGGAPVKPGTVASIKEVYEQMQRPPIAISTTETGPIAAGIAPTVNAGMDAVAKTETETTTEVAAAPTTPTGRRTNQFPEQVRQIAERAKRMDASHAAIAEFWRGVIGAESEMVEKKKNLAAIALARKEGGELEFPPTFLAVLQAVQRSTSVHVQVMKQLEVQVLHPVSGVTGHADLLAHLASFDSERNDPAAFTVLCFEYLDKEAERLNIIRDAMISHQAQRVSIAEQEVALNREKQAELEKNEPEKEVEAVVQQWLSSASSIQLLYLSAQSSSKKKSSGMSREASADVVSDASVTSPTATRRVHFPEMPAKIVGEGARPVTGDGENEEDDDDDEEEEDAAPKPAPVKALSWQEQLELILAARDAAAAPAATDDAAATTEAPATTEAAVAAPEPTAPVTAPEVAAAPAPATEAAPAAAPAPAAETKDQDDAVVVVTDDDVVVVTDDDDAVVVVTDDTDNSSATAAAAAAADDEANTSMIELASPSAVHATDAVVPVVGGVPLRSPEPVRPAFLRALVDNEPLPHLPVHEGHLHNVVDAGSIPPADSPSALRFHPRHHSYTRTAEGRAPHTSGLSEVAAHDAGAAAAGHTVELVVYTSEDSVQTVSVAGAATAAQIIKAALNEGGHADHYDLIESLELGPGLPTVDRVVAADEPVASLRATWHAHSDVSATAPVAVTRRLSLRARPSA